MQNIKIDQDKESTEFTLNLENGNSYHLTMYLNNRGGATAYYNLYVDGNLTDAQYLYNIISREAGGAVSGANGNAPSFTKNTAASYGMVNMEIDATTDGKIFFTGISHADDGYVNTFGFHSDFAVKKLSSVKFTLTARTAIDSGTPLKAIGLNSRISIHQHGVIL